MNLNPDQLQKIEQWAEMLASLEDISVIMQLPMDDLKEDFKDKTTPFARAYERGFRKTKLRVRNAVIEQAIRGSSPSQQLVEKIISAAELINKRDE